jgi:hypothetical protein
MILDTATKLEAVLVGAVSASQPEVHVDYKDWSVANEETSPQYTRSALNSTTDVTILAAPVNNPKREVTEVSIYNKDSASVTVIVKTDDGTTERIITRVTLATLETLFYGKMQGWYAITAAGARK